MPLISVIVYKTETYIRPCVDSILAQTLEDVEVILVDDGSPDGCPVLCDEYAARDPRVRVIHKENGGLVSAWKAGVRAAGRPGGGPVYPPRPCGRRLARCGLHPLMPDRLRRRGGHSPPDRPFHHLLPL